MGIQYLLERTLIIGNCGTGKTTLAQRISSLVGAPIIGLDAVHWQGDVWGHKRSEDEAKAYACALAQGESWVMEGVFGWLASAVCDRVTTLVWLDYPWDVCAKMLWKRGQKEGESAEDFAALMEWAQDYWTRETSSSFVGHARIFDLFALNKFHIHSPGELEIILEGCTDLLETALAVEVGELF